jgi:hypothetical protein
VLLTPEQIVDLAEGAALSGRLFMQVQREGEPVIEVRSWVSALWLRSGTGWRLRLFHSTKAADQPAPDNTGTVVERSLR